MSLDKYGLVIPVSRELLSEYEKMRRDLDDWFALPAEERRRRSDQAKAEMREKRARVRSEKTVAFANDGDVIKAVEAAHSWPGGYLRHLAQPYCDCGPDRDDGWWFCSHAEDEFPGIGR